MDYADAIVANARRLLEGRSKSDVARQAGVERTKLYRFLNGKQVLRADELLRLADVLEVDVGLFYGASPSKPDFQSAFMQSGDFALRISSVLLGPDEQPPPKDTWALERLLRDVEPDPEAERVVTDLCDVLRSPALSALAFIGAWVLLWNRMTVDDGLQMARAARRIIPTHEDLMVKIGSVYYRKEAGRIGDILDILAEVEPEPLYMNAVGHLRYVLSIDRIDQCASLAHKVLEKNRRRTQQDVHRRLLALKSTIDSPDAPEFWGKLLTFLDPNIP
jgi:transcriptional regulator with XRE-family HTH domain